MFLFIFFTVPVQFYRGLLFIYFPFLFNSCVVLVFIKVSFRYHSFFSLALNSFPLFIVSLMFVYNLFYVVTSWCVSLYLLPL